MFLDYDGVLTPIVDRTEDAVLSERMRGAVHDLASGQPAPETPGCTSYACPTCRQPSRRTSGPTNLLAVDEDAGNEGEERDSTIMTMRTTTAPTATAVPGWRADEVTAFNHPQSCEDPDQRGGEGEDQSPELVSARGEEGSAASESGPNHRPLFNRVSDFIPARQNVASLGEGGIRPAQ